MKWKSQKAMYNTAGVRGSDGWHAQFENVVQNSLYLDGPGDCTLDNRDRDVVDVDSCSERGDNHVLVFRLAGC